MAQWPAWGECNGRSMEKSAFGETENNLSDRKARYNAYLRSSHKPPPAWRRESTSYRDGNGSCGLGLLGAECVKPQYCGHGCLGISADMELGGENGKKLWTGDKLRGKEGRKLEVMMMTVNGHYDYGSDEEDGRNECKRYRTTKKGRNKCNIEQQ